MISYLSGQVHHKTLESLTLLVNGVGYLVFVPPTTLAKISSHDNLDLYIHTQVREDLLDLYGFLTAEELSLFKHLISVSGIGPKTALPVVDRGVETVKQAIMKADEDFFTLVPRLGKKNAQKIIIELKGKLGSLADLDLTGAGSPASDLIEALLAMGYTRPEAIAAIRSVPLSGQTLEEQIRLVLRRMNKVK